MAKSLRNVRQAEAIRAFVRLGGVERQGKGSQRVISMNGRTLSVPSGTLKVGLLNNLIKVAGLTPEQFQDAL